MGDDYIFTILYSTIDYMKYEVKIHYFFRQFYLDCMLKKAILFIIIYSSLRRF
jgi:hypothetical protein